MKRRLLYLLACVLIYCSGVTAQARELLTGVVLPDESKPLAFSLRGESRKEIIGGEIQLGDAAFIISKISRLGLIGASRVAVTGDGNDRAFQFAELVVFSSSFSGQTAVGQPWVAGKRYLHCDQAYNSFIAVYRIESQAQLIALGKTPYPVLVEDVAKSDDSTVYCFYSKPPV